MTASDGIRPTFASGDAPAPDPEAPEGSDQRVSDPDDETTRPDATVTIDEDEADPLDERPVGDPDS